MSGSTPGGAGQAPVTADPTGQAPAAPPATPHGGTQPGQAPAGTSSESVPTAAEWARWQAEMADARKDAAKYRDELKKLTDAQMTAEQKQAKDLADLQARQFEWEAERQGLYLAQAIGNAMGEAGIAPQFTASEIASLLTANGIDVVFEDNGRPKNVAALLKQLVERRPFLAAPATPGAPGSAPTPPQGTAPNRAASGAGGATNPGRGNSAAPRTLEDFARMSPAEYAAHRGEYLALLERQQRRR